MFVLQNYKIQSSETGPLLGTRKTLDNNDLNQVVASKGFRENKCLAGVLSQSHGLIKPGLGHSYLRIFLWTLRSAIGHFLISLSPVTFPEDFAKVNTALFPFWRMANGVKLQSPNF